MKNEILILWLAYSLPEILFLWIMTDFSFFFLINKKSSFLKISLLLICKLAVEKAFSSTRSDSEINCKFAFFPASSEPLGRGDEI